MILEETLSRNSSGRFEVGDFELTSGCSVEIQINGQWLLGTIEHWQNAYYWFSTQESIAVILRNGINARIST